MQSVCLLFITAQKDEAQKVHHHLQWWRYGNRRLLQPPISAKDIAMQAAGIQMSKHGEY